MKIGVFSHGWWKEACAVLSHDVLELPVAEHPSGNSYAADLAARISSGTATARMLADDPVDLLVDNGGTGFGLVQGTGKEENLKLAHEVAGKQLVSIRRD